MVKSAVIVPEVPAKKASQNVCHKAKHTLLAKKVAKLRPVENADKIPKRIAKARPRTSKPNRSNLWIS
jgi:hypothetical protein